MPLQGDSYAMNRSKGAEVPGARLLPRLANPGQVAEDVVHAGAHDAAADVLELLDPAPREGKPQSPEATNPYNPSHVSLNSWILHHGN